MESNQTRVEWVQVPKKDSAFVYAILESLEGWVSFSTARTQQLPKVRLPQFLDSDCYLILRTPESFTSEMNQILSDLAKKIELTRVFSEWSS